MKKYNFQQAQGVKRKNIPFRKLISGKHSKTLFLFTFLCNLTNFQLRYNYKHPRGN